MQMAYAALRLAQRPALRDLRRWMHMLGFRGHFVTKSRLYSTNLGELRATRAAYRARQDEPPGADVNDDDSTVVLSVWQYLGSGYLRLGDSALLVQTAGGGVEHHSDTRLSAIAPHIRYAIDQALSEGRGYDDPGYSDRTHALLAAERAMRNRGDGYWIAADDPHAALHSLTGEYNLVNPTAVPFRIALISDGIKRAVTHLQLYNSWHELIENLIEPGILPTISRIRDAELDDPDASQHPRTKASDDAAAITCELARR
jgi:replication initiator protein RepSA